MQEITNVVEVVDATEVKKQDNFDSLSDERLRDLIGRASHLLEQRITERRKNAIDEIRRLARENGLTVSVRQAAGKRGRKRAINSKERPENEG